MNGQAGPKHYDLEERTFEFAKRAHRFCNSLPKTPVNREIGRQLVRSAASVGANYIEANEALGKKDFLMRVKICRKEAKETGYWLRLVEADRPDLNGERETLLRETIELTRIFGAIVTRSK